MLDQVDARPRRRFDAASAMGVGCDLEVHRMGHVDDALHLGVGEMLLEAHRAGIEHPAGGHDLDHVDAAGPSSRTTFWHSSTPVQTAGLRCASSTALASSGGRPVA